MSTKTRGDIAEEQAARYLKAEQFDIVEQNYYAKKLGEIDIIASKHGVLHFVEVKSGTGFNPIQNLSPSKLAKVIKSANLYMKHHKINLPFCIDACIIEDGNIEFIENITV